MGCVAPAPKVPKWDSNPFQTAPADAISLLTPSLNAILHRSCSQGNANPFQAVPADAVSLRTMPSNAALHWFCCLFLQCTCLPIQGTPEQGTADLPVQSHTSRHGRYDVSIYAQKPLRYLQVA